MTVRDIEKYRRRNPAQSMPELRDYRVCTVIPCYNENASFGDVIASLKQAAASAGEPVAVLAVINFPEGADESESLELLERIKGDEFDCKDLFCIYAPGLKGGVGEARKIGMDTFLQSRNAEDVSQSIICSMDGDTLVDADYFKELIGFFRKNPQGGAVPRLRHLPGATAEEEKAIRCYEAYMDRYVVRLKQCNSPYAFHTVGSAFAVRGEAYIKCGGMKVRLAGEDFYFLQALAKSSGIGVIDRVLVFPSARISGRTPFGTGQAVRDIVNCKGLPEVSDAAFERLAKVLEKVLFENLDNDTPELPEREFFEKNSFYKVWPGIRRNTPPSQLCCAFHIWFDGLKTLRFLHWCDS